MISFPNDECTSTSDSTIRGTCLSFSECNDQGGSQAGNCAAGFGVCCVFSFSSSGSTVTVNRNSSYLSNSEYPSSAAASTTSTYSIEPSTPSDICYIRLDFNTLVVTGPTANTGACGTDTVTVTSPISTTANTASPPVVCGTLSGQHMYVETGSSGSSSATITITLGASSTGGTHRIKVGMIECTSTSKPPSGCVQYFTGTSNTVQSYNYQGGQLIQSQFYTNCIRQEYGYCSMYVRESGNTSPDPFQVASTTATVISYCNAQEAWVSIPSNHADLDVSGGTALTNRVHAQVGFMRCGSVFGPVAGAIANTIPGVVISNMNTPFVIRTFTHTGSVIGTGFSLDYHQKPCP